MDKHKGRNNMRIKSMKKSNIRKSPVNSANNTMGGVEPLL